MFVVMHACWFLSESDKDSMVCKEEKTITLWEVAAIIIIDYRHAGKTHYH